MKTGTIRLLTFLGLLACAALASAQNTDMEFRARALVTNYFTALTQGDTRTVLSLIGGELLSSRQQLLRNPEYSTYLSKNYQGASTSITGSRQVGDNLVEVEARIEKSPEEQFAIVLLVESRGAANKKLLIVDERDATN